MEFKDLRVKEIVSVCTYKTKNAKWNSKNAKNSTLQVKLHGKAVHNFGDRKFTATENCIYFLNQYEDNDIEIFKTEDEVSSIAIMFTTYEPIETPSFCIKLNNISEIIGLFNKIKVQKALTDRGENMAFSYFYRLCAIFEEYRQKEYYPRDARMVAAKEYIDLNFDKKDCLEKSAEQSKMSRRRFNELFKNQFNITPNRYLISRRVETAMQLLAAENLSISEISEMCGFGDIYYFSKVFKAETGYTPGKYRQNNK